ncbi:hypothetical protein HPB50_025296 [Hyalomma asiaticum]|uniref:Uncharacterized protein n=1 Tax=Hyalomma asiaticum TaxID=266040 RepID=A0ACB7S1I1_HYAAI|nr:hypothetical protein HPB50_025296 [Hyalomma asiaticum]
MRLLIVLGGHLVLGPRMGGRGVAAQSLGRSSAILPEASSIDKDRFAGRRNGEDSEEITSVEATWQHLQSSRKHSPRNRGPGSNGSKSTATTRATTGQHDDQTKVTPRRRGRQPRANTPKL